MMIQSEKKYKEITNDQLIRVAPSIGASQPYHEVSDRYAFVPTISAVNYLRDAGWKPVMAAEVRARKEDKRGFQKHMIRFTRPDLVVNGHRMDLLLYNSHDRGCAFQLIGGVFRFVCSNGLIIGDRMAEYSHRHVGFEPEKFVHSALEVGEHLETVAGVVDEWQTIDLTPNERGIFAQVAHQVIYDEPDKAPIEARQLLVTRRFDDRTKSDLWTTFNTVQENTIRGGLRGRNAKGQRTRTRAVKSIDRDKNLNMALWTLTQKMAELKAN
jgi:hypothetical protein